MSDTPQAVATIKFYADKRVEVELSSIRGITPRTLEIAGNILHKTYRGKKAEFIRDEHAAARESAVQAEVDTAETDRKFHEKEDKRLAKATKKVLDSLKESLKPKKAAKKAAA